MKVTTTDARTAARERLLRPMTDAEVAAFVPVTRAEIETALRAVPREPAYGRVLPTGRY